jgi:hypothetical protein
MWQAERDAEESLMPLPSPTAPASKTRLRAGCILSGLAVHAEEKVYTYYGLDNSPMIVMSIPRGTVSGDTWTGESEGKMGGRIVKDRFVIEQRSATRAK